MPDINPRSFGGLGGGYNHPWEGLGGYDKSPTKFDDIYILTPRQFIYLYKVKVITRSLQYVKIFYLCKVINIISTKTLNKYKLQYSNAAYHLTEWYNGFRKQNFTNFNQLKAVYPGASLIGDNRIVFNIKDNDFRLLTMINFRAKACYVLWFGSHAEYDKKDMKTISFKA